MTSTERTWLWWALASLTVVVAVAQLPGPHATAWHFFDDAAQRLVGLGTAGDSSGLHLYRDHPELQFGPLSVVVALPFSLLGAPGTWLAMAVAAGAGLVAYRLVIDAVEHPPPTGRRVPGAAVLAGGVLVALTWGDVAVRTAHVDDAIALVGLAAALRCCTLDRGRAATLALAIAAAAKPWALVFAPLALVPAGRNRIGRVVVIGAAVAATWAPFVLADAATLDVGEFTIRNDPTSALRAIGIDDPVTPSWVRPAQLAGGLVVVAAAVLAGRWRAAAAFGLAWRLLLEPGAHRYYTAGVVLALLFVELRARPGRLPWATAVAAGALEATALPAAPDGLGAGARLLAVLFVAIAAGRLGASSVATGRSRRQVTALELGTG